MAKQVYYKLKIKAELLDDLTPLELDAIIRAKAGLVPRDDDAIKECLAGLQKRGFIGKGYPELLLPPDSSFRWADKRRLTLDPSQARDQGSPALDESEAPALDSLPLEDSPITTKFSNDSIMHASERTQARVPAINIDDVPEAKTPDLRGHALRKAPGGKLRPQGTMRRLNINQRPRVKRFSLDPPDTFSIRWMRMLEEIKWAHRWGCIDTIIQHLQRRILERAADGEFEPDRLLGSMWFNEQETEARRMHMDHFHRQPQYWIEVIDWFFDDPFWCDKIMTTKTLRRNYPRFVLANAKTSGLKQRINRLRIIGQ